ncbi:hypothetical protein [Methyloglobulus sp.]|uniref:hypothetical protein n=1 Tax=Methyloglobulus sp. TaxID=2518622 RepID=UPI0032B7BAA3
MKNISSFLSLLGLSAITSYGVYGLVTYFIRNDFPSFPIEGWIDQEWGVEHFPLAKDTRIFLSMIWYGLLLAVLASIPLCIAKRFKSTSFYQAYKIFWWCGALVFSPITGILTGLIHTGTGGIQVVIFLVTLYITIAYLAILPAHLQHKYYNKP